MKILFIGDVVGKTGRLALKKVLPELTAKHQPDFVIVNGENATHGRGTNRMAYDFFVELQIDAITGGDHTFDLPETNELLDEKNTRLLRPANYPDHPDVAGVGFKVLEKNGQKLGVINLQGRVFMKEGLDNPFTVVDSILKKNEFKDIPVFVDFHTEATSEIAAMGWHLDGRAVAVVGTHTHIPTADERILPAGTAFISDVGMCGSLNSMLGDVKETIIRRFLTGLPFKVEPGPMPAVVNGVIIEANAKKSISINRVSQIVE
jgi:metallophosphoesterase (TIGR00282 family)